jgi:hypothetical protein
MLAFFTALLPLLGGFTQPLKDWIAFKREVKLTEQNITLATLNNRLETLKSNNEADTEQRTAYLGATSQKFKEGTYCFVAGIIIFSIFSPTYARVMWENFSLIPDWFRIMFVSMHMAVWGIPVAREQLGPMFAAAGKAIEARREYKLEKARINREAVFAKMKAKWFPNGMNQQQVNDADSFLDAGER